MACWVVTRLRNQKVRCLFMHAHAHTHAHPHAHTHAHTIFVHPAKDSPPDSAADKEQHILTTQPISALQLLHVCLCVFVSVRMFTYIHIHTHTCTHTDRSFRCPHILRHQNTRQHIGYGQSHGYGYGHGFGR